MNRKHSLLGISITALIAVGMISAVSALNLDQFDIQSASSDGSTLTMEVKDKIKQIPAGDADDLITFYAWVTFTNTGLQADAITVHHGVNDHQAFGKDAQSSPVQSYHPHEVTFDGDGCIVGLASPKVDFKVQDTTVTMESSNGFDFAATGTVGPRAECTATGLGITDLYDTFPAP